MECGNSSFPAHIWKTLWAINHSNFSKKAKQVECGSSSLPMHFNSYEWATFLGNFCSFYVAVFMMYFKNDFAMYFIYISSEKFFKKIQKLKGNRQYKTGYNELLGWSDTPNNVGKYFK